MQLNGNLQFSVLGSGELQNAIIERLASAPTGAAGRLYYDTVSNAYFYHNGTSWIQFAAGTTSVASFSAGTTGFTPSSASTGAITLAGTLVAANGGTGFASYTTGDILYASGATAFSKLAAGTSGQVLHGGTSPSWSAVSLTADVTGTLPVGNGGTGVATITTNGVVVGAGTSPVTTVTGSQYNVLVAGALGVPGFGSIDLSQSAAVGSSILAGANGGTGVANTGKTITLGGSLTTSGGFDTTFTMTAATAVTFPTSGTLATVGGTVATVAGTTNQIDSTGTTAITLSIPSTFIAPGTIAATTSLSAGSGTSVKQALYTNASNEISGLTLGDGQLVIGSTGNIPVAASLTAGTGISVTPGAGSISIANTGVTSVTLSSTSGGITLGGTNPITTTGTISVDLSTLLNNVSGLAGNGFIVQNTATTVVNRSITGTSGNIDVANGDGVTASPTIDLASVSQAASGNFVKVTLDGFGRVTGNTAVTTGDITTLVDSTYVNVAGDTMTGSLTMTTGTVVTLPDAPTASTDAANKGYVDAAVSNLNVHAPVETATQPLATDTQFNGAAYANGTLGVGATLTAAANSFLGTVGAYQDLSVGSRVLVDLYTSVSTPDYKSNGIYVVSVLGSATNGIATTSTLVGGSAYTNGTYVHVPLTGGTGSGAQATVVVSGGAVTSVTITNPGTGYTVADTLSASNTNLGGTGSGFSVDVATNTTAAKWVLTRASDYDNSVAGEVKAGDFTFVQEGFYATTGWTETTIGTGTGDAIIIGTDPITFVQFSGAGTYTAGTGLTLTGTQFSVNLGAGIAELPAGEVGVDLWDTSTGALILTDNGTSRATDAPSKLYLLLDGAGALAQTSAGLKVNAASVTNAMLANSTVPVDVDSAGTTTMTLGTTFNYFGTANRITTAASANTVTFDISTSYVGQSSITTLGTVTTGTWSATTIAADKGGTGFSSYTIGDLLYADSSSTLAKLADVAVGNVLRSGGVGNAPAYGKVDLTTDVTGVLPSANGGTGVNNSFNITLGGAITTAGAFVTSGANSLTLTTTGATNVTLPTSGTLLTSATAVTTFSGDTTGLTPSTPTSGAIVLGGTLVVANGGTGATSLTAYGVVVGNGTGAVAVTAAGAAGTVLHGNGAANPTFGAVDLTADVTGVLPIANGGTGFSVSGSAGTVLSSTDGTTLSHSPIQYVHTYSASTSFTVAHNLGQKYVLVQVYDNTDNQIIPQSIVLDSTTQCTVTVNSSIAVTVVVMGILGA